MQQHRFPISPARRPFCCARLNGGSEHRFNGGNPGLGDENGGKRRHWSRPVMSSMLALPCLPTQNIPTMDNNLSCIPLSRVAIFIMGSGDATKPTPKILEMDSLWRERPDEIRNVGRDSAAHISQSRASPCRWPAGVNEELKMHRQSITVIVLQVRN